MAASPARLGSIALLMFGACAAPCDPAGPATLEVGVPDSITFLDFEALPAGGDIPLSSNGQTFLAVQAAIRGTNLTDIVTVTMDVTLGGMSATSTTTELMRCREDEARRYLVPVVVSSEDLGPDRDIQDQLVDIAIRLEDDAGNAASGTASGVLRRR